MLTYTYVSKGNFALMEKPKPAVWMGVTVKRRCG